MPGFVFLLLLVAPMASPAEQLKPARRFDITIPDSYAYEQPGPYGISYLSPGKLAVWFTDNTRGELSRRDRLQPNDPWRMKLHIFDTASGAVETREYPTHKVSTGLQVQSGGSILLLNGPLVRCLSADFRQDGSVDLPETTIHRNERVLANSPGGHAVWAFESANVVGAARIDARSCKLTDNLEIPAAITSLAANDDLLIATDKTHVGFRSITSNWKVLYRADSCCIAGATFANQSVILVYREIPPEDTGDTKRNPPAGPKRSLLFLDLQGKTLLEEPLESGFELGPIVPSSTGRYVLIASPKPPDFSSDILKYRLYDARYRVWIYDTANLKRVAEFEISRNRAQLFAFALSPDARQVAVLEGDKVAIYDVPNGH